MTCKSSGSGCGAAVTAGAGAGASGDGDGGTSEGCAGSDSGSCDGGSWCGWCWW